MTSWSTIAPKRALVTGGVELWIESMKAVKQVTGPTTDHERELVATFGERIALDRLAWAGETPDGIRWEADTLRLTEVDENARLVASINFDLASHWSSSPPHAASASVSMRRWRSKTRWARSSPRRCMRTVESTTSVKRMVAIDPRASSVTLRAVAPVRTGGQPAAGWCRARGSGSPRRACRRGSTLLGDFSPTGPTRAGDRGRTGDVQLGKLSGPLWGKGFRRR